MVQLNPLVDVVLGDLSVARRLARNRLTILRSTAEALMLQETGSSSTRREFARNALQSLTALALIEGLWSSRLFGAGVRPLDR